MRDAIDFSLDLKDEEFFATRNIVLLLSIAAALLLGFVIAYLLQGYFSEMLTGQTTMVFLLRAFAIHSRRSFFHKLVNDYPLSAARTSR